MIKKISNWGIIVCTLVAIMAFTFPQKNDSIPVVNDAPEISPCFMENNTFQAGEEITYKLYYNWNFVWLAAGEVTFRVRELGNEYHLSAHGRTYKSYEWFFKVRDKYDTYVEKETLLPTTSIRNVAEGGYRLYDEVTFFQEDGKATSLRGKTRETAKRANYDIENCMHDILSIIYYTRNLDFNSMPTEAKIPIKIFMDKEVWPLTLVYKGKEPKKKIKGKGKFKTILFSPEVIEGYVFKKGTEMKVWVSDDENKIPLLIESPVSVGSVKAVLKDYRGLKHKFKAKN